MKETKHPLALERRRRNLTQGELASRVRLCTRTIWCAENNKPISLDSRRRICAYLKKSAEELGLHSSEINRDIPGESEEAVVFDNTKGSGGVIVAHFDETKRNTLRSIVALAGTTIGSHLLDTDPQFAEAKTAEREFDLDLIDNYIEALRKLLAKGEAAYVLQQSQSLYNPLEQKRLSSNDVRFAEVQARLGMLVGAAQEYVLPWYQRDQAVLQTYNYLEKALFQVYPLTDVLLVEYIHLLAKRGRHFRVLWQFGSGVKACEAGLNYVKLIDNFALLTHFLCERAHIEATQGNEQLWLQNLEEARRIIQVLDAPQRAKATNQINYMQGEGYKRLAFHVQKDFSISTREKYASLAIPQFAQWDGASIEVPSFEALVVQTSEAQCMLLLNPDEALRLAGQLRKQAEQNYPALLDKLSRVELLAHQRLQSNKNTFSQLFRTSAYRAGKNVL